MQACNRMSNHCVPLYDSLGENAIEYIVDHAECTCVFLSSDKFPQFVKVGRTVCLVLKHICCFCNKFTASFACFCVWLEAEGVDGWTYLHMCVCVCVCVRVWAGR